MEAVAAIGLASAIVQFVDFGSKVANKLKDAMSGNLSGTLEIVQRILPLLLTSLKDVGKRIEFGDVDDETQKAVLWVVEGMTTLTRDLEKLLGSSLIDQSKNSWRRRAKAISTLLKGKETKLDRMLADLQKYYSVLVLHQTVFVPNSMTPYAKPPFMVPFARDKNFIRRGDILQQMRNLLYNGQLVILAGIGGSG